jgi:cytochrome P450
MRVSGANSNDLDERAFTQPNEFIPDRWTTKPDLVKNASVFTPFGTGQFPLSIAFLETNTAIPGRYSCAGKQLGLMELRSVTSQVIRDYAVRLAEKQRPGDFLGACKDGFTLSTGKLELVFDRRNTGIP